MINYDLVKKALKHFKKNHPFDHCVVDHFFEEGIALALADEFLSYESSEWHCYKNAIEDKKTLNDWNIFPALTYQTFDKINSPEFTHLLEEVIKQEIIVDQGLHGGGWHIHGSGGNLNPHLDYSIHPKLKKERKINLLVYLAPDFIAEEHGGHLGLYAQSANSKRPGELIKEIAPVFNRAVIFDTTQNSWHGISRPLNQPEGIYRKSIASYYLVEPKGDVNARQRALFAPRENQIGKKHVEKLIELRSNVSTSTQVYRKQN